MESSDTIIALLQTALTPAFLLVALGSLLNLFTGRLARIVDRSRILQEHYSKTTGRDHDLVVNELRDLEKRIGIVNMSIGIGVISAITVCILISLLFIMGLRNVDLTVYVSSAFIIAMIFMASSLIMFLREVNYAIINLHIREEFLELPTEEAPKKKFINLKRSKPD